MEPVVTLVLLGLGAGLVYVLACVVWPFAACWRCGGAARFGSPSGRAWRSCPRCQGTGRRVRAGRRVAEMFRSNQ